MFKEVTIWLRSLKGPPTDDTTVILALYIDHYQIFARKSEVWAPGDVTGENL